MYAIYANYAQRYYPFYGNYYILVTAQLQRNVGLKRHFVNFWQSYYAYESSLIIFQIVNCDTLNIFLKNHKISYEPRDC